MAVLDSASARSQKFAVPLDVVKQIAASVIWPWYHQHQNDVLLTVKKRILGIPISHTFRVSDAKGLIEILIGPDTTGVLPGVPA